MTTKRPNTTAGPSLYGPFVVGEILRNTLMHIPLASRLRKRAYSVQKDAVMEVERQKELMWNNYALALDAVGGLSRIDGASVLEVGPGPILATGVLFIAHGAAAYHAIDRYDVFRRDQPVRCAYGDLIAALPERLRKRCDGLVNPVVGSRLFDGRIVTGTLTIEEAAAQLPRGSFHLIVSHNVLEHVQDLRATLESMKTLLAPGGVMVHRVDVSTHTLRAGVHPLWQLTVPDLLWALMYSARAYPNRLRPTTYWEFAACLGLETLHYRATGRVSNDSVESVRKHLLGRFASLPVDDLSTLDFVWVARIAGRGV